MKTWGSALVAAGFALACRSSGDLERLQANCQATTTMGPDLCRCVAQQATIELSADARALLLALMEKRPEQAERLRQRISLEDATRAATFLVRAPTTCAKRQSAPSRTEGP